MSYIAGTEWKKLDDSAGSYYEQYTAKEKHVCTYCKAPAGKQCRNRRGHILSRPHKTRIAAFRVWRALEKL
jgi:hypothetical protein